MFLAKLLIFVCCGLSPGARVSLHTASLDDFKTPNATCEVDLVQWKYKLSGKEFLLSGMNRFLEFDYGYDRVNVLAFRALIVERRPTESSDKVHYNFVGQLRCAGRKAEVRFGPMDVDGRRVVGLFNAVAEEEDEDGWWDVEDWSVTFENVGVEVRP
eukprot:TRINITY_DN30413_c0_g1_i1.p1 TRINITY_DN30413_c0_g1~~TRINITY_DN30413_c0_g1_i1.p1  ORF type:complete len:157 (+),score=18.39 TRINITY_DN30413_c0_g1_i1:46-516(+)